MWEDLAKKYHLWSLNWRAFYYLLGLEIKRFVSNPTRILDVGSGSGIFAEELRKLFPNSMIVCIDSSLEMCKLSRAIIGRAESLPFKDRSFDLITFIFSLHELKIFRALKEAFRVLKNSGWVYILDLDKNAPDGIKKFYKLVLRAIISPKYANHVERVWKEFESCENISKMLNELKFDVKLKKDFYSFRILAKKI